MKLSTATFLVILGLTACKSNESPVEELTHSDTLSDTTLPILDSSTSVTLDDSLGISNRPTETRYSYKIVPSPHGGFGYEIYDGSVLFINQPHIPAVSGMKGFSTKEKAQKTAEFAVSKMDAGFVPPTISKAELDSLGVLN